VGTVRYADLAEYAVLEYAHPAIVFDATKFVTAGSSVVKIGYKPFQNLKEALNDLVKVDDWIWYVDLDRKVNFRPS
jgi:hypothetical protein